MNVLIDISDRKLAEQLSSHLAAIIESSDDAIISKSLEGTILSWNSGAEQIFGYRVSEALGKNISLLVPADRFDEEPQILAKINRGERIDHYETVRQTKDGRKIDISLSVSPIRDKSGRIIAASKICRDISERKRAEAEREELLARERAARAEAEAANRAKDEFLAILSHELRTPLNVMIGWARLLKAGKVNAATQARALEALERNASLQTQLINELLDVSGIVAGKLRLEMLPVDLHSVIHSAVEVIKPAAQDKNIELQLSIELEVGPLIGDPGRLHQIVWNLLSNAVKFSDDNSFVQLRLQRTEAVVEISQKNGTIS
ncbi:MAG: PAS domain-containing sensor histidine kinase [Acidobacteriota bacterium]